MDSRLLCLWDFPSKNTGMGCHFFLQGIFLTQGLNLGLPFCRRILFFEPPCVLRCFSHVQLCVTLWTAACQASLSMGFSKQEHWSGLPCPPPGDLPDSRIEPASPTFPALAGRLFTTSATWEAYKYEY